jgi:CheY-like chemotaxis protein
VTAWEWGCPSAVPLSRLIKDVCGRQRMMVRELHFLFRFLVEPIPECNRHSIQPAALLCHGVFATTARYRPPLVAVVDDHESVRDSLWDQYQGPIDTSPILPHSCAMAFSEERSRIERPLVAVVDDDESVRESLPDLLGELGFAACAFPSAEAFLSSDFVGQTKCAILEIAMPGMSGLDLRRELQVRGQKIPIVFITAQTDEAKRAKALKQGAVRILLKPFSDTALLEALNAAVRES